MDMKELVELAETLNAAYEASDTLVKNTELLAEPTRKYIRDAIVDFFNTKRMLLAIANGQKIRATHTISRSVFGNIHMTVSIGCVEGMYLCFHHNGVLRNERQSGDTIYGAATDGTQYTDCALSWSCGQSPSIQFDLTYADWMRQSKTLVDALRYFDTHKWTAEGYTKMKKDAALMYRRIDIMKQCLKNYADSILDDVKTATANLVAGA